MAGATVSLVDRETMLRQLEQIDLNDRRRNDLHPLIADRFAGKTMTGRQITESLKGVMHAFVTSSQTVDYAAARELEVALSRYIGAITKFPSESGAGRMTRLLVVGDAIASL